MRNVGPSLAVEGLPNNAMEPSARELTLTRRGSSLTLGGSRKIKRSICWTRRVETWENSSVSPTVLRSGPYRFFFFASDRNEPKHVHVVRERKAAKFWLSPVRVEYNYGCSANELNRIQGLVQQHEAELLKAWHDYFKRDD